MNPMNPYAMKIQWINSNPDSWNSRLLRFFGKADSKKVHVVHVSGFNTKASNWLYRWKNPFWDFSFLSQGLIRD